MVESNLAYHSWMNGVSVLENGKASSKEAAGSFLDELRGERTRANYSKSSAALFENLQGVKEFAQEYPLTTAALTVTAGVALYGAVRLGVANKLGIPLKSEADSVLVHLTKNANVEPIMSSGKIGGKWGIFGLEANKLPENNLYRNVKTLVSGELSGTVPFRGEAVNHFYKPIPVGPFSLYRNLAGVRNSWLGSVDINEGKFVANEIFKDGVFRPATAREIGKFKKHQYILDYGIDVELWSLGSVSAFSYEMNKPRSETIKSRF
jgi:hypothetical protein